MNNFTPTQQQAVSDKDQDILVSASAGSGKTTVLVQRVLEKVRKGIAIDSLLIVTFTEAAAAEMKERIQKQLELSLEDNPNDPELNKQLIALQSANISTLHAFCLNVIRRFYYVIDLDPGFSLLTDDTQTELLKEQALKNVLSANFAENNPEFNNLMDNFAGDRSLNDINELILKFYQTAIAKPNYKQWFNEILDWYDFKESSLTDSALFQKLVKPDLLQNAHELQDKVNQIPLDFIEQIPELAKLADALTNSKDNLNTFVSLLESDAKFDELREYIKLIKPKTTSKPRVDDDSIQEKYQEYHVFHKQLTEFSENNFFNIFLLSEERQIKELMQNKKYLETLIKVEQEFINEFQTLKQNQNLLDFNDLEQMAYQILTSDNTNSDLAKDFYQKKFTEILVDEYQDTNPIQEAIVQAVSNPKYNHLFMVGDVKQSIYGFRQAEPNLFLNKYHAFNDDSSEHERIIFAENFRSTKDVTGFVNYLFNMIMTPDFGGIDYQAEGNLIPGAQYPEALPSAVEVSMFDKNSEPNQEVIDPAQIDSSDTEDENDNDTVDLDYNEIQLVITRIKKMIEEGFQVSGKGGKLRPLRFEDVAILTPTRTNNLSILEEFSKHDLPLLITDAPNYFQTIELTMLMSYLAIIDNPDQDIPLVGVMRSPMYQFSEPELAEIRINSPKSGYYNAVLKYTQDENAQLDKNLQNKVNQFLADLNEFRKYATLHRISELIWHIYEKTRVLEIVTGMINGRQRRLNLQALYERAAKYEAAGFKGLYQFITFINRLKQNGKDLAQPLLADASENAIRLMTIHGSKGLEFPVVFLVGLDGKFNLKDTSRSFIINSHLGVGFTNSYEYEKVSTLMKTVLDLDTKKTLLEEKARVLYVALTRAKQKLILIASTKDWDKKEEQWLGNLTADEQGMQLQAKTNAKSFLEMIGPMIAKKMGSTLTKGFDEINLEDQVLQDLLFVKYDWEDIVRPDRSENKKVNGRVGEFAPNEIDIDGEFSTIDDLFKFDYKFKESTRTTAYQAVSEIKQYFGDPNLKELSNSQVITSTNRYLQPIETRTDLTTDHSFSPAEIGTATHLILQKHDFTAEPTEEKLQEEINQLVLDGFLSEKLGQAVKQDQILKFLQSDFGKLIGENSDSLEREVSFSTLIPANLLFENYKDDQSQILIHGTIDGYFKSNKGIILFDYKTDYLDPTHLDTGKKQLLEKYRGQLNLYEQAINSFEAGNVVKKYLISLSTNQLIEVKPLK